MSEFKVDDCNYVLLSEKEKRKFAERYCKLFQYGIPFKLTLVPEKANSIFGAGFRRIYISAADEYADTVRKVLASLRVTFTEVSEGTALSALYSESKPRSQMECSVWDEDVSDRLLTALCVIQDCASSVVTATFTPLPKKEEVAYLKKKRKGMIADSVSDCQKAMVYAGRATALSLAREAGKKIDAIHPYLVGDKHLYSVKLEVIVSGDSPDIVQDFMKLLLSRAEDFDCKLRKSSDKSDSKARQLIEKWKNRNLIKFCDEDICAKFIPFMSAEVCDDSDSAFYYGVNQITKNLLLYDRRNSKLPSGFVVGCSGSGKGFWVKHEALQVLEKTQDDVIIIDPSGQFARSEWYDGKTLHRDDRLRDCLTDKCRRIELQDGDCHINPLDVVIDSLDMNGDCAVAETADLVVGWIERLLFPMADRTLDIYEVAAIRSTVRSVLSPFVHELAKSIREYELKGEHALAYDFERNPTFGEVIDRLLEIEGNENLLELQDRLQSVKPYLKAFYGKTNIPEDRGLVLGFEKVPCKLEPFYYAVTLSYINRRIFMNHRSNEQGNDRRLWVYFDEAHQLFKSEYVADTVRTIFTRSRMKGAICTAVSSRLTDFTKTQQGQALINNSGFMVFLNQAPIDREEMRNLFNISDDMLEFVHDRFAGCGIFYNNRAMIPFQYDKRIMEKEFLNLSE